MNADTVHIGAARIKLSAGEVRGDYLSFGAERFYRIANYDRMNPFFMSIVSASDHWLFISSHGGLTAGRQNSVAHASCRRSRQEKPAPGRADQW